MVVAGPSVNGNSAPTPEAAQALVAKSSAEGYDLIKTHADMTREAYDAMAAEAANKKLRLVGHVTPGFGLWRAIEVGQHNEHMDGFIDAVLPQGVGPTKSQFVTELALLSKAEPARFRDVARALKAKGLCVGPTLSLYRMILGTEPVDHYAARPELKYAPPKAVEDWKAKKAEWLAQHEPGSDKFLELRSQALKALKAEGVVLSAGGDSPHPFLVPGFSLRREMEAMVAEGLSPADVFRAATADAAHCLGEYGTGIGQIAVGRRADLILLDGDPTAALKPLERPAGVMVRGRWLDRGELDRMLQAVADSAAKA
jgi:imidazolonepropionase-like amidohydrolase